MPYRCYGVKRHKRARFELVGTLHDSGATELPPDCDVPVSAAWRDLVQGEDRVRALRALEASAITGLRKGLRRGSVWINLRGTASLDALRVCTLLFDWHWLEYPRMRAKLLEEPNPLREFR